MFLTFGDAVRYFPQFQRYNVRIIPANKPGQFVSNYDRQLLSQPAWAGSGAHEATVGLQFCACTPHGTDNGCVEDLGQETRRHNSENIRYMGT
jgi:hypothetical protein